MPLIVKPQRFSRVVMRCSTVLVAAFVVTCSSPNLRVTVTPPPAPLTILAVLPVQVRFPSRPAEAERQTLVLLDLLWQRSAWSVLTPSEFAVLDRSSTDYLHATDLVITSNSLGLEPAAGFGVLRATLSAREASGHAIVSGSGRAQTGHDYDGWLDATVEILSADGHVLASAESATRMDPFAELPEHDAAPWIREGLTRATLALVEQCKACVRPTPRPTFVLNTNPASIWERAEEAAIGSGGTGTDALDREQRLWRFFQFFEPTTTPADAKRLKDLGGGVCAGNDAQLPFQPGDCIVSVDGAPPISPHTLFRALRTRPNAALHVVDRQGGKRTVNATDLLP